MKTNKGLLFTGALFIIFSIMISGCGDSFPESPYSPDDSSGYVEGDWEDVLAADDKYPDNVYLTENIEFEPGQVGSARQDYNTEYYDENGYPLDSTKNGACGPPEGTTVIHSSSYADMTVLGSGGWAVWKFDPDWVIVDGEGDDFIIFSNHNCFGSDPDGSWNELAHVYVSEDNETWYISSLEDYIENTSPGTANSGYSYYDVTDVFGNEHCWANFREEIEAEELDETGVYETVTDESGNTVYISMYFEPDDDYLGGDRFDLSNFVLATDSGVSWPADGKMRYLKLVDDPSILDGQDYAPAWMTGARIMSAMGINVEPAE
ncbi:MAG: hypothetical protein PQJ61_14295 [Spirochaetales bacterium]|uniref:Uncharacterized protein n=1 Tax=Candidatus Thalassospirochaeta sargassi TaxID=3119039 RepID=A0AAJ1IET3_9SPIO|nr:hypothetical protein [Spirochaetales bacterium]